MLLSAGLNNNLFYSLMADSERAKEIILNSSTDEIPSLLDDLKGTVDSSVFIYDVYTGEITSSVPVIDEVRATVSKIATVETSTYTQGWTIQEIQIYLQVAPLDINTEPGKMLVVTRSAEYIYDMVNSYKRMLFGAVPIIILFALLSGFIISSYFLRPIKAITRTAEKIDPANLIDRIPVKSSDELGRLSKNLNALFDRIYGCIDRQKRFTANASHDLRAPLTNIKAETSLALRKPAHRRNTGEVIKRIDHETEHLNTMVDDLLTLASMDTQPEHSCTN